jgi:GntR family transcriptional regulator
VRANADPPTTPEQILDQHIAGFFRAVRELSLPAPAIRARVADWLIAPPPDHLLLIESDAELRQILLAEIAGLTACPVVGASLEECVYPEKLTAAIPLCRPSKAKATRAVLPAGVELITLQIRSANVWLGPYLPALKGKLVGVASAWPEFLTNARTMLIAAGLDLDTMIFRDTRKPRWNRGLDQAAGIICDVCTANLAAFPKGPKPIVFLLLADTMKAELARYPDPPTVL